jgi:hypothetical protein
MSPIGNIIFERLSDLRTGVALSKAAHWTVARRVDLAISFTVMVATEDVMITYP